MKRSQKVLRTTDLLLDYRYTDNRERTVSCQGEPLVAVRQNTEAADEALQIGGRRIRLAWAAEHTYVLDQQQEPDAKPVSVENTKEK